jgi:hypothetical protein
MWTGLILLRRALGNETVSSMKGKEFLEQPSRHYQGSQEVSILCSVESCVSQDERLCRT